MKKLLLVTTAIAGVAMMSAPASAMDLDLGGFFKGYGMYANNHEAAGAATSLRTFEFRRQAELHVNGESTLDNGLTVGAHGEMKIADASNADTGIAPDEIYAYFSGAWGRVNFGIEDGAAYLLQVNAPSADSNIDGMRTYIQALNMTTPDLGGAAIGGMFSNATLDYDHADFKTNDRLTYMTPKFNGFQAAVSYTPEDSVVGAKEGMSLDKAASATDGIIGGVTAAGVATAATNRENLWEVAARYDGEFQGVGVSAGAGYSTSSVESQNAFGSAAAIAALAGDYFLNDGIDSYNGGLNFTFQGFSLGGSYGHSKTQRVAQTIVLTDLAANYATGDITRRTYVFGGAYDQGPYHVGASYLNQQTEYDAVAVGANADNIAATKYKVDKFALGGGYTFGPGMTFRGSVAWGKFKAPAGGAADNRYNQVGIGADVQF